MCVCAFAREMGFTEGDGATQMHSNIGYIFTLALNLSLLLPLMTNAKVNNYVIVL